MPLEATPTRLRTTRNMKQRRLAKRFFNIDDFLVGTESRVPILFESPIEGAVLWAGQTRVLGFLFIPIDLRYYGNPILADRPGPEVAGDHGAHAFC
jgi:hypothetical protein